MAGTIGRPRAQASTTGLGTQRDILTAAARLFTEIGYGGTSTHAIAREARISQPTLYHYYSGKHEILLELLLETVRPSAEFAGRLRAGSEAATARLAALCVFDVMLLLSDQHNIGALYLLPELGDERFADFRAERTALYRHYRDLVAEVLGGGAAEAHDRASLVFGLVESVILRRRTEPGLVASTVAGEVADAALAILGVGGRSRASAVRRGAALATTT